MRKNKKYFILIEVLILTAALAAGGYLRLHGVTGTTIENILPDEARIGLGAASIIHYRTPIFNYASPHEPPLSLYYPIPFLAIFGHDLWVLKIAPILFGIAAVALTYFCAKEMFSIWAGAVAAFFIAVLPFHISFSRVLYEHSFLPAFSAGIFFCYARHLKNGNPRLIYVASLMAGLALSTKIIFLYYIASFVIAAIVAGRTLWPKLNLRQALISFSFFVLGSLPLFALALLSRDFLSILMQSRGGGIFDSPSTIITTLHERFLMFNELFTPTAALAAAVWIVFFAIRKKIDSWPLFLMVFCIALSCFSIITISGIATYHMLVFLPAPILLAAGIVELPIERYPNFAGITAILGIVVISYLWQPAFRITNTPFGIASTSIVPALDSIPLDKTIATQKDISMIHTYLYFMKTGKLPSLNDFNIVSLHSNRFYPKEMRNNPKFLFKDIDACYRETLTFTEKKPVPWNSYLDPDFFTEKRVLALKQTINDLIYTDGYRHFIFYIIKSPNHPYDFLNKQTIRAMESILEQDHKLRAVETDYDGAPGCLIRSFRIIDIELPAEDGGK